MNKKTIVCEKKRSAAYGGIVITCGAMLIGSLELIILILLGNTPAVANLFSRAGLEMLAPILAWLLIGESISWNMAVGIVLFLIGSGVALWGGKAVGSRQ